MIHSPHPQARFSRLRAWVNLQVPLAPVAKADYYRAGHNEEFCMKLAAPFAAALALYLAPVAALAQEAAPPVALPAIDPLRLSTAQVTVQAIFPPGTYARIMKSSMDAVMGTVMDKFQDMPLRDLAGMTGIKDEALAKLGKGTIREVMAIYDPAFNQRIDLSMHTMMNEMTGMMTQFEPGFRDGLARAYAKRFTVPQLTELNRFFASTTGAIYASESMTLFTDPEVMTKMQEMLPELMKQMPSIIGKVQTATASLPKPRQFKDLSAVERSHLAQLLGVSEAELGKGRK
jgi:hypothetical protein